MALLRNLRGIFCEMEDPEVRERALEQLKRGVRRGRQLPFRYLSAWKAVGDEGGAWAQQVQDALEECMSIACENLPALPGRSAFLTDNSGSAWNTCPSEWGTMRIAEIGNLSSVIVAMRADVGVVYPFGDKLESMPIHRDEGVLAQAHRTSAIGGQCGGGTENGIWLFFRDAIMRREHWDNIFVYSDMQAGHGGLYGIHPEDYKMLGACLNDMYVDVNMLVKLYREHVNPKVNVCCIQTVGQQPGILDLRDAFAYVEGDAAAYIGLAKPAEHFPGKRGYQLADGGDASCPPCWVGLIYQVHRQHVITHERADELSEVLGFRCAAQPACAPQECAYHLAAHGGVVGGPPSTVLPACGARLADVVQQRGEHERFFLASIQRLEAVQRAQLPADELRVGQDVALPVKHGGSAACLAGGRS